MSIQAYSTTDNVKKKEYKSNKSLPMPSTNEKYWTDQFNP